MSRGQECGVVGVVWWSFLILLFFSSFSLLPIFCPPFFTAISLPIVQVEIFDWPYLLSLARPHAAMIAVLLHSASAPE